MTKQETVAQFIGYDILNNGYYQYEGEITRSLPEFSSNWHFLMLAVERAFNTSNDIADKHDIMWDYYIKKLHNCFWSPEIEIVYEELYCFIKWYNEIK